MVRQLLRGWPAENLFWWSCRPDHDQTFGQKVAGHPVARIPEKLYPHRRWGAQKSWVLENIWARWAVRRLHAIVSKRPHAASPHVRTTEPQSA